ncbi:Protein CBR-MDT-31 [Caenorhabditis briggsae]|uniref:Mediator of RNA polymerase II transcription subunit 31 n=2 Tax=Caenorhabditis briggsae TaxID=6238 RepID=MED31_CAEBR|nr:Protein CBR-MDT-31 [Caenorhabditis briggsae]Q61DP3.2 RecName: Full=Mediator of RNA polymerase II transcription subunit 31; AltName: Full=Mediator complex subunit 31; AltName: Full=Mediator complex subunit soh-1 [Caenorhabditis briggsae]CAP31388.2 Protein CBR-MDT-31 [Caenorhabditis briggsae]
METPESEKTRFEVECEFVQALANPNYLNFLAQRGYFKEEYFVNYLKYLLYWKNPQYARCLKFPQCLHMLEALQSQQFRDAMAYGPSAKFVEDQVVLQWQFYLRKRHRLCMLPEGEDQDVEESEEETVENEQKESEDEEDVVIVEKPEDEQEEQAEEAAEPTDTSLLNT